MLEDSKEIQDVLVASYPGLEITGVAAASGKELSILASSRTFSEKKLKN